MLSGTYRYALCALLCVCVCCCPTAPACLCLPRLPVPLLLCCCWQYAEWYLQTESGQQIEALLSGVASVLHPHVRRGMALLLTPAELGTLIAGSKELDVEDWQANAHLLLPESPEGFAGVDEAGTMPAARADEGEELSLYRADVAKAQEIYGWLWAVVGSLDAKHHRLLLKFVSGSESVPTGGFASLSPQFSVLVRCGEEGVDDSTFPISRTCMNYLFLAPHESQKSLKLALLNAILSEEAANSLDQTGEVAGIDLERM